LPSANSSNVCNLFAWLHYSVNGSVRPEAACQ
jgi:hypothetical protein